MRPNLNQDINIENFRDFYWLKEELQLFCRENGISPSGSKMEIADRIEAFLRTGEIKKPVRKSREDKKKELLVKLSLDTSHY